MPIPRTHRVALYARTSTDDKGQDPELQLVELRRLAEHRAWTVAREYVDAGVSGSKDRRPALDRLMADAQAGKLDAVAVWRFDRFARSTQHLLAALEQGAPASTSTSASRARCSPRAWGSARSRGSSGRRGGCW